MTDVPRPWDDRAAAGPERGDEYATWDGPYVLGALGRAERLEYEAHLAHCPSCRAAVAELAGLPGLLGRVEGSVALALTEPNEPETVAAPDPPEILPRLVERTREHRRRGRLAAIGGAVVAAAAAVAIAVPITVTVTERGTPHAATQVVAERRLDPVVQTPVSASVKVIDADGKATVEMSCRYATVGPPYQANFELWMTPRAGAASKLFGWSAGPGDALTLSRTTDLAPGQIASVEIRSSSGTTILRAAT
ncbi:anti-sigma factor family protein [Nocardia transvalensis]|uniref:anti-sigma factor family protein n=1 Tax=Nocardia transvalensis TaxID=37333 RepID=UPI001895C5BD|nr:zf-HC2 domain-containing protein [Nocardia transvalensis]MBF6328946.1 zf-HC2 domain-containing protein [Nocardia transvalensis]